MQIHRDYAETLLAQMKSLHSKVPTIVPARESQYTHLDMGSYRDFRTELEAQGYRFLADYEVLEISTAPESVVAQTMIRSMISADGTMSAAHYQLRPRMAQLGIPPRSCEHQ